MLLEGRRAANDVLIEPCRCLSCRAQERARCVLYGNRATAPSCASGGVPAAPTIPLVRTDGSQPPPVLPESTLELSAPLVALGVHMAGVCTILVVLAGARWRAARAPDGSQPQRLAPVARAPGVGSLPAVASLLTDEGVPAVEGLPADAGVPADPGVGAGLHGVPRAMGVSRRGGGVVRRHANQSRPAMPRTKSRTVIGMAAALAVGALLLGATSPGRPGAVELAAETPGGLALPTRASAGPAPATSPIAGSRPTDTPSATAASSPRPVRGSPSAMPSDRQLPPTTLPSAPSAPPIPGPATGSIEPLPVSTGLAAPPVDTDTDAAVHLAPGSVGAIGPKEADRTGITPGSRGSAALAGVLRATETGASTAAPEPQDRDELLRFLRRSGYRNGEIRIRKLADVDGCRLLPQVAEAWVAMRDAARVDGLSIGVADCYRSIDEQQAVYEAWCAVGECAMAAEPGTSTHGHGIALDVALDGRTIGFASREFTWLVEHGPYFGFYHPEFAGIWSPTPEPWHFEYLGPLA